MAFGVWHLVQTQKSRGVVTSASHHVLLLRGDARAWRPLALQYGSPGPCRPRDDGAALPTELSRRRSASYRRCGKMAGALIPAEAGPAPPCMPGGVASGHALPELRARP